MKLVRLVCDYRWPIYIGALLTMPIVACGALVYVATRPDTPTPIEGYYRAAQEWDASEAIEDASRQLGWTVSYELPGDVPVFRGMPRPIDVAVADRDGRPVTGLSGDLVAIRPSDTRLDQRAALVEMPTRAGHYRTLVRLDEPGAWEIRLDTRQRALRFVHAARLTVMLPSDDPLEDVR
jgi:hypothetical protein